jgi:hypothetical protein
MPPLPELLELTGLQWAQRGNGTGSPAAEPAPQPVGPIIPAPSNGESTIFDHPAIGGKLTLFVLLYGMDHELHRRCLRSLAATNNFPRLTLRVICHQVTAPTLELLSGLQPDHVYTPLQPLLKYESMRLAFHDPQHSIDTRWVVWLDDVSWCRRADWLEALATVIAAQDPAERVGAVGNKFCHVLAGARQRDPREWFRTAAWYRGAHFRTQQGAAVPNGNCVHYVCPNFFAISTEAIRSCDIPDARLRQTGGGIVLGEQLHQNGFKLKTFNTDRRYVNDEQSMKLRGVTEQYPWQ